MSNSINQNQEFSYPVAPKADIVEDYHGTLVADPYRGLEDPTSPETLAWVGAENVLSEAFLSSAPARPRIKARLTELWNYARYGTPYHEGDRYFFSKNDGLQNQDVIYMQQGLKSEPVLLLDPNQFSPDGTIALTGMSFSNDGTRLAYKISTGGSDWQQVKIRTIEPDGSGQTFDETLEWCKFTNCAWKPDNSGFYYTRFPDPHTVALEEQSFNSQVFWHQVGTPQSNDVLIYARPDFKELGFGVFGTDDDQFLCLHVSNGTNHKNRFYYRPMNSDEPFVRLLDQADARYSFVGNVGSTFYFDTDLNAPRGRIVTTDVSQFKSGEPIIWQEIIPEQPDAVAFVTIVNQQLVLAYMHDVHHEVKLYDLQGHFVSEIELPPLGSIVGLSGKPTDNEMFLAFESYLYPMSIFRYDFQTHRLEMFRRPQVDFDAEAFEAKQVFYPSKDGTRISMFLVYKKGLKLDGQNPTLLYGYGGFGISLTPTFNIWRSVWLANGGIIAVTNLRGGGEYGEDWHQAAMFERKQNVFDDFIAASEWLIANHYTSTPKLAIMGGSNGGLLTAACMLQRPDLFGAVVCKVPVIDMLRFHRFTVGRYWTSEYGNAETNAADFKYMYAYSPLHNVKAGVTYPPLLLTTADSDDRVVPSHAKKFAATLQAAADYHSHNPLLIRIETKAGHGAGKPTTKQIDELSDELGFLARIFDMDIV